MLRGRMNRLSQLGPKNSREAWQQLQPILKQLGLVGAPEQGGDMLYVDITNSGRGPGGVMPTIVWVGDTDEWNVNYGHGTGPIKDLPFDEFVKALESQFGQRSRRGSWKRHADEYRTHMDDAMENLALGIRNAASPRSAAQILIKIARKYGVDPITLAKRNVEIHPEDSWLLELVNDLVGETIKVRVGWRRSADVVEMFSSGRFVSKIKQDVAAEIHAVQSAESEQVFEFAYEDLENVAWKEICEYADAILSASGLSLVEELDPSSPEYKALMSVLRDVKNTALKGTKWASLSRRSQMKSELFSQVNGFIQEWASKVEMPEQVANELADEIYNTFLEYLM